MCPDTISATYWKQLIQKSLRRSLQWRRVSSSERSCSRPKQILIFSLHFAPSFFVTISKPFAYEWFRYSFFRWTLFGCCRHQTNLMLQINDKNDKMNEQIRNRSNDFQSYPFDIRILWRFSIRFWWLLTCFALYWLQIYHGIGCVNCQKMWLVFHFLKHCSCTTTHCAPYQNRSVDYIHCRFWIWGKWIHTKVSPIAAK